MRHFCGQECSYSSPLHNCSGCKYYDEFLAKVRADVDVAAAVNIKEIDWTLDELEEDASLAYISGHLDTKENHLKPSDIAVGDWLKINDVPAVQVVAVEVNPFRQYVVYYAIGGLAFGQPIGRFEPIPLTPEILEKNGYTCKRSLDEEIISYNWTSPDRRVTLNDTNGSPWFCIIRSDGMMEEVMIGISYVHELQHALRFCGIKKEIIL